MCRGALGLVARRRRGVKAPDRSTLCGSVRASLTRARRFAPRSRSVQCYGRRRGVERSAPFSPTRVRVSSCHHWSTPRATLANLEPGRRSSFPEPPRLLATRPASRFSLSLEHDSMAVVSRSRPVGVQRPSPWPPFTTQSDSSRAASSPTTRPSTARRCRGGTPSGSAGRRTPGRQTAVRCPRGRAGRR